MSLKDRYESIDQTVAQACQACGRAREDVRVIGVSKTVGLDAVAQAIEAGIHDFGENRPEELARKHDAYPEERWHFIGNIQSRQLSSVVGRACLIHSLCKEGHADKISRLAQEQGIVQDVLIEINDGEENKKGMDAKDLETMLLHCAALPGLRVVGLMTMAPLGDLEAARRSFRNLRALRDGAQQFLAGKGIENVQLRELSMGMSNDYLEAIPEGATMVRVGRAIFSDDYVG